jgi:TonB family protein
MWIALLIALLMVCHTAAAKPPPTPVVQLSPAEAAALSTHAPLPEYPLAARRQRITGTGVFYMEVQIATGKVQRASVERSTGSRLLDMAALSAFNRWRFKPQALRSLQQKYAPSCKSGEMGVRLPTTFSLQR